MNPTLAPSVTPTVTVVVLRPTGRDRPWAAYTVALILAAAAANVLYLFVSPLDLSPDEAHYWDWSRRLAWSYYSKGPFVAWLIRGSCELFGDTVVAVRLPAVACGTLMLLAVAQLARRTLGSPKLAFLLVAAMLTLPPIAAGAVLTTIDAPFLCCWAWALVFVHRAIFDAHPRAWHAAGGVLLVGTLTKYTMLAFPVLIGLYLFVHRERRPLLFGRGFRRMTLLGLLGLLPILAWNATHGWLGLWHLFGQAGFATGPKIGFKWYGPFDYAGGQFAFLAGYWFCAWAAAAWAFRPRREQQASGFSAPEGAAECSHGWSAAQPVAPCADSSAPAGQRNADGSFAPAGARNQSILPTGCAALHPWLHPVAPSERKTADQLAFLWWLSVPLALAMLPFSLRVKVQPNWPATAYLPGVILSVAWLRRQFASDSAPYRRLVLACLIAGTVASASLAVVARFPQLALPLFAALAAEPTDDQLAPVRNLDPTARLRGWKHLAGEVDKLRDLARSEDGQEPLVGAMVWTLPGELGFYCRGNPQVYTFGAALSDRFSQYDVWRPNPVADAQAFRGRTFVYVGEKMPDMNAVFDSSDGPHRVEYRENGVTVGGWKVWIARGYRGFPASARRTQY